MMKKIKNRFINETIESKANEIMEKLKLNKSKSFDYVEENEMETCEQCGGEMKENECMECGMREEVIYEVEVEESKYVTSKGGKFPNEKKELSRQDIEMTMPGFDMEEYCAQYYDMDRERCDSYYNHKDYNHKDSDRPMDEEMEEGNAFTDALRKTKKGGSFKLGGKTYKDRSSLEESTYYRVNYKGQSKLLSESSFLNLVNRLAKKSDNSVTYRLKTTDGVHMFTESEMLNLIEDIVLKEERKFKKGGTPKGYSEYERSVKKSKKENDEYIKSVGKKMKDYLKDGSKSSYDENPKYLPKGNGQLEKMKTNKYTMSKDGEEFLDNYMRPGMEDLVPEEIEYNVDWVSDNIKGSSRTGNNPEWANAEKTELGDKLYKKMKDRKYHNAKLAAYRKSKQPVTDGTGENSGSGVKIKTESLEKRKETILSEEFSKMKNLISYDRKTQ